MKKTPTKTQPQKLAMTVGNVATNAKPAVKTSGTKVRGGGAAIRGTLARGPMA